MIDVGFLAEDLDGLRVSLVGLAGRRVRTQVWTRLDEFLLAVHEVRAAVVIDVDLTDGRLAAIVGAARRLSSAKIVALASDEQIAEASSAYEFGLNAVVSKKLTAQVAAAQIYNMALKEASGPRAMTVEVGEFKFDELARQLIREGDVCLRLTEKESQILSLFLRHDGEALQRDQISMEIFAIPYQANDRRIDVHISNLRRKLRSAGVPYGFYPSRGGGYYGTLLEGAEALRA